MKKIKYCVAVFYEGILEQHFVEAKSDSAAVKKAVLIVKRHHSELVDWVIDLPDAYLDVIKLLKEKGFVVNCLQVS
jgi:hypothetical protein